MPRPRSPNRDKAYEIYKKHNGNIENRRIAEQLDEDERLIAVWKSRDKWLKKNNDVQQSNDVQQTEGESRTSKQSKKISSNKTPKKVTGDSDKKSPVGSTAKTNTKSRGGQPGNNNAAGNKGGIGAPLRNKHAIKTHEYATVFFTADIIDEEERQLLNADYDKYLQQLILIDTLKIREKRIFQDIRELRQTPGGMIFDSVTKNKGTTKTQYMKRDKEGKETPGSSNVVSDDTSSHVAQPVSLRIMKLEEVLNRVQSNLQKAIAAWHKMEQDDEYLIMDKKKLLLQKQKIMGQYDLDAMIDDDDLDLEGDLG